ncbi:MAG: PD-(D/E)XK nuclease family protein [Elusimicrobia bacterium]|nr:PD-(D/E)XK nuclease family protein [Elusimicrobiota bacterium]
MKADRLSISAINQYLRCGNQYLLVKLHGYTPPGISLIQGKAVHASAEKNLRQKARSRVDLPVEELEQAAADNVEEQFHGQVVLTDEEQGRGLNVVKGEAKDFSTSLAKLHREKVAPTVQPLLFVDGGGHEQEGVEVKVVANIPRIGTSLVGVLDVKEESGGIRDLKTSGKKPSDDEAEKSGQLTMYAMLDAVHAKQTGIKRAETFTLDYLVRTPSGTLGTYRLDTQRDRVDMTAMVDRIAAVKEGIEKEIFLPTNPDNWFCSARFCGFYSTGLCRYVAKGARRPQS